MKLRKLMTAISCAAVMLWSAGSAFADEVRIGFMPYLPYSGLLYAKQKGYVEQELKAAGLTQTQVSWKQFVAGAPVSEALAAQELDIGVFGATPALVGRASGQDTRVLALASVAAKSHALVVRADLPITKVSELAGKKVATTFGSTVFELLNSILEESGMGLGDVQLLNMTPADMSVALRTKAIDAAVVWDPLLLVLTGEKTVNILRDGVGLNDNINLVIGRVAFTKRNPQVTRAVLRGIDKANKELAANLSVAATQLAPVVGLSADVTDAALRRYTFTQTLSADVRTQLTKSASFMISKKIIRRPVAVPEFLDESYQR